MLTKFRAQAIAAPRKTLINVNVDPSGDFAIREDEMVENLCQGEDRSWKRKKHKARHFHDRMSGKCMAPRAFSGTD